jgi:hypothetical protein
MRCHSLAASYAQHLPEITLVSLQSLSPAPIPPLEIIRNDEYDDRNLSIFSDRLGAGMRRGLSAGELEEKGHEDEEECGAYDDLSDVDSRGNDCHADDSRKEACEDAEYQETR